MCRARSPRRTTASRSRSSAAAALPGRSGRRYSIPKGRGCGADRLPASVERGAAFADPALDKGVERQADVIGNGWLLIFGKRLLVDPMGAVGGIEAAGLEPGAVILGGRDDRTMERRFEGGDGAR